MLPSAASMTCATIQSTPRQWIRSLGLGGSLVDRKSCSPFRSAWRIGSGSGQGERWSYVAVYGFGKGRGPASPPLNALAGMQFATGEAPASRSRTTICPFEGGRDLDRTGLFGLRRASADVPLTRLFINGLGEPRFPRPIAQIPEAQIKRHPVMVEKAINRGRQELLILVSPFIAPDKPSLNSHRATSRWLTDGKSGRGCTQFQTRLTACAGEMWRPSDRR